MEEERKKKFEIMEKDLKRREEIAYKVQKDAKRVIEEDKIKKKFEEMKKNQELADQSSKIERSDSIVDRSKNSVFAPASINLQRF